MIVLKKPSASLQQKQITLNNIQISYSLYTLHRFFENIFIILVFLLTKTTLTHSISRATFCISDLFDGSLYQLKADVDLELFSASPCSEKLRSID
jgi:hypothetical protein